MFGVAIWSKVTALARRAAALVVSCMRLILSSSRHRWAGAVSASIARLPLVGQQLLDPTVQLRRQPREDVLQVGPRLMPLELGRVRQAHHDGGTLARQLAANEEPVLFSKDHGPDPVFAVVVVQRHVAVEQELPQPGPPV